MIPAPIIAPVAAAVATELALASSDWSQAFTVSRTYDPSLNLEAAASPLITVLSGKVRYEPSDRDTFSVLVDTILYLRQAVEPTLIVMDGLVQLLEAINRHLFNLADKRLPTFLAACWNAAEMTPVFTTRVRSQAEYRGVLIVTWQVFDLDP